MACSRPSQSRPACARPARSGPPERGASGWARSRLFRGAGVIGTASVYLSRPLSENAGRSLAPLSRSSVSRPCFRLLSFLNRTFFVDRSFYIIAQFPLGESYTSLTGMFFLDCPPRV